MEFFDTPPLRYMGSKWRLSKWITAKFPPHARYVEPFCGSASVFFRKEPSEIEVLNDLNGDLVNFFRVLRNNSEELVNLIELTPFAHEEYLLSWEPCADPIESARRFYVRSRQSFSADTKTRSGWRRISSSSRDRTAIKDWRRLDGLRQAVLMLRRAQIDNLDAVDCMERNDTPETLFYVDPPYVHSTRKSLRYNHQYRWEMTDDDHYALAECLHRLKGMVIVSGYDSPLYQELYKDWYVCIKSNTTNGNSVATEYLWLSPNATRPGNLPLFRKVNNAAQ